MFKPTMAAVIGLVCVAACGRGDGGREFGGGRGTLRSRGPHVMGSRVGPSPSAGDPSFAQVPASHAAYGWRYPYVFRRAPSPLEHRLSARPAIRRGDGR